MLTISPQLLPQKILQVWHIKDSKREHSEIFKKCFLLIQSLVIKIIGYIVFAFISDSKGVKKIFNRHL